MTSDPLLIWLPAAARFVRIRRDSGGLFLRAIRSVWTVPLAKMRPALSALTRTIRMKCEGFASYAKSAYRPIRAPLRDSQWRASLKVRATVSRTIHVLGECPSLASGLVHLWRQACRVQLTPKFQHALFSISFDIDRIVLIESGAVPEPGPLLLHIGTYQLRGCEAVPEVSAHCRGGLVKDVPAAPVDEL